jgi:hypothetical protein
MKLFEALIRLPNRTEFKDTVLANNAYEAKKILQQRYGISSVPYLPNVIVA